MIEWSVLVPVILIFAFFFRNKVSQGSSNLIETCYICEAQLTQESAFFLGDKCFCKKDLNNFNNSKFVSIYKLRCSPESPEKGVLLYEFKISLVSKGLISYIDVSYEEDGENIISNMNLFVRVQDREEAVKLLPQLY